MDLNISFYIKAAHGRISGLSTQFDEATLLFSPLNERFNLNIDFSDTYFSRLVNRSKDVDGSIVDIVQKKTVIAFYEKYFIKEIVPKLNPHTGHDWSKEIYNAIQTSFVISDIKRKEYIDLYKENEEGLFLAHTFMYCLSVSNRAKPMTSMDGAMATENDQSYLKQINDRLRSIEGNLPSKPINLGQMLSFNIPSENYNVSLTAKDPRHSFILRLKVAKNSLPDEYENFDSLFSYLVFSGKKLELPICSLDIYDYAQNLLRHIENKLFVGESTLLPDMYSAQYDDSAIPACPGVLFIQATGNTLPLELRNEYGETILPLYNYKIEREVQGDSIYASFTSDDDPHIVMSIIFKVPKIKKDITRSETTLKINIKNPSSSLDNIGYYSTLSKMKAAEKLTFYKCINKGAYTEFISTTSFASDNETLLDDSLKLLDFFKKVYKIEATYRTVFDVRDMKRDDAYFAEALYTIIDKGFVRLTNQNVTMKCTAEDTKVLRQLIKENKIVKWDSEFEYIQLFGKTITFHNEYNMCWVSNKISFKQNSATVLAEVAVIYKSGMIPSKTVEKELSSFKKAKN
ncbi:hypothetical protein [Butyrivibrio sp. VCB2006]|uniref:hypothetical protein n=1 Tax=Butyrivibrio sp. VCB2006 TaxID=1280679 RepID=UPI000427C11E|nr:hypothetical protein [Butyrivibrio sp. VCB2006]